MGNSRIISADTLNPEHLMPRFIDVLSERLEQLTFAPGADAPNRVQWQGTMQDRLGAIEARMALGMDREIRYFESEACEWDMEWLQERLSECAPEGTFFGASEGDGACFGFWDMETETDECVECGERFNARTTDKLAICRACR